MNLNSKEENSDDFCPNYVQEFGLWARSKRTGDNAAEHILRQRMHWPLPSSMVSLDLRGEERGAHVAFLENWLIV